MIYDRWEYVCDNWRPPGPGTHCRCNGSTNRWNDQWSTGSVLYRDGKTRLASETASAVLDGLQKAWDRRWYIGILVWKKKWFRSRKVLKSVQITVLKTKKHIFSKHTECLYIRKELVFSKNNSKHTECLFSFFLKFTSAFFFKKKSEI